jgi:predicted MPP superfamily phosphohydrolase
MRPLSAIPLAVLAAGAAGVGYAAGYEVRSFRLRRVEVPVLPAGARPLRVLHISDLHLTPGQRKKQDWLRRLDSLDPDLVVSTGDHLAHQRAVPVVLDALGPLLDRPGVYVFGSNDYYAPMLKNPARYLWRNSDAPLSAEPLPWSDLRDGFNAAGWLDLTNTRGRLKVDDREIEFAGVDDPHLGRDRYDQVAGVLDAAADLNVGVLHAPYRRVLDRMAQDGFPLILAGHTHGGQLCVPFYGPLVTNCDLDRKRAKGLSRYSSPFADDHEPSWLHVSAGCGTSPYAPVRFACPPEATLLTLVEAG